MLELSTGVSKGETDYFDLVRQIRGAELQVMYNYPYMLQFLNESRKENVSEALMATEDKRGVLPHQYNQLMRRADLSHFRPETDIEKLTKMIELTVSGLMTERFVNGDFQPELFGEEIEKYLIMLKKMSYQEV